ncbi:MAG: DUF4430 domain-containing protein [Clostridia bacterium]|nr:DUF4430 domain-containing protein [Clostridia bacterium]
MKRITAAVFVLLIIVLSMSACGVTVTKTDAALTTKNIGEKASQTAVSTTHTGTTAHDATGADGDGTQTQAETEKPSDKNEKTTVSTTLPGEKKDKSVGSNEKKTEKTAAPKKADTIVCTVEINCAEILEHLDDLKPGKKEFLPAGGVILKPASVELPAGSTAFDALKKACAAGRCADNCAECRRSGIQLDYVFTPGFGSYYVRGIHQLYEKDCGEYSGWLYSVNGRFPNYGCSKYTLKNGDSIRFVYTCELSDIE